MQPVYTCDPIEQLQRQQHLELLYEVDGRSDPAHPAHGTYTGLFQQRISQLVVADRQAAVEHLPDCEAPLFSVLLPFIGRGLIEDPEAARAICAAWCRGTSSRLHWAMQRLQADEPKVGTGPVVDSCRAISGWLLHEAMRAELGE
jgi:hypothetical protein